MGEQVREGEQGEYRHASSDVRWATPRSDGSLSIEPALLWGATTSLPKYQVVADYVRGKIADGSWLPGTQIPSVRELAEQFDATATTINNAVRELKREGTLVGRQGSGTYVAEPTSTLVEALQRVADSDGGWLSYSGPISADEARRILVSLQDGHHTDSH